MCGMHGVMGPHVKRVCVCMCMCVRVCGRAQGKQTCVCVRRSGGEAHRDGQLARAGAWPHPVCSAESRRRSGDISSTCCTCLCEGMNTIIIITSNICTRLQGAAPLRCTLDSFRHHQHQQRVTRPPPVAPPGRDGRACRHQRHLQHHPASAACAPSPAGSCCPAAAAATAAQL